MKIPLARACLSIATFILCLVSATFAVRLALADQWSDEPRSLALFPGNARYLDRQAVLLEIEEPQSPRVDALLRSALRNNPRDSFAMMRLGLRAEAAGSAAEAERLLLAAAAMDHTFRPLWTLTNFYFRQGQFAKFWLDARACLNLVERRGATETGALEAGSFDPRPVFELCWQASSDPVLIRTTAIPDRAIVHLEYLRYLLANKRLDAALDLWGNTRNSYGLREVPLLLDFCDPLIAGGQGANAAAVWKQAMTLASADAPGALLFNANLAREPRNRGFDWTLEGSGTYRPDYVADRGSLRMLFDRDIPDSLRLLSHAIAISPSTEYRLRYTASAPALSSDTGLRWHALHIDGNGETAPASAPVRGGEAGDESFQFRTPPNASLLRLTLEYHRPPGALKKQGELQLSNFQLEKLP